jgi:hypothetical protein
MSRAWRWCLLGPLAAIVVIGLMPNALLTEAGAPARSTLTASVAEVFTPQAVADPFIPSCADSSCSKGVPSPVAPALTVVAAAVLAGVLSMAAAGRMTRRQRSAAALLPRGNFIGLFRPPQFS